MPKTFYVITETEWDYSRTQFNVLYAFDEWEEADKVLTLLRKEDETNRYDYELHTVNNDHPFPKSLEEETRKFDAKINTKEVIKKLKEKQADAEKAEKQRQETENECIEFKEKIDEFLDWLKCAKHSISIYNPDQIEMPDTLVMTPQDYYDEATIRLSSLKPIIQKYLLSNSNEQVKELLNKPVYKLLNLPLTEKTETNPIYVPKRLRQLIAFQSDQLNNP